jgi:hypothetical protein
MKAKPIDVVYVIGNGSRWKDNELRFSLRSITKNLSNIGKIFIVGECPDYLKNIIHIPAGDIFDPAINADGNIITKVLAACEDKRLSETFLFINDDHLVIKPVNIAGVPPFHKGSMETFPDEYWNLNYWRKRLQMTKDVLLTKQLPCFHFDCHTPILMNKEKFKTIVAGFDYKTGTGLTMKSIYGNSVYGTDGILLTDQKKTIFKYYKLQDVKERILPAQFLSFNDQGLNDSLKWWLIEQFPNKCKYESSDPQDRIFDIFFWMKKGNPYQEGVTIFKKYFKHKNLIEMFENRETESLKTKLKYKILQSVKEL